MFKLVTLFLFVACASAQSAAKFPAGIDPAKCPNFPICDNAVLHNQAPANHWNAQAYQAPAPQQQWNQWQQQPAHQQQWQPEPQWNAAPAQQWNAPAAPSAGGDKYPAGVNPLSCPNYPYCETTNAGHGHHGPRVAPLPGYTERLYPAGVSAAQCPNYPEC